MGTFSNYLENKWLDHLLDTAFTVPTVLALSLHTANPDEDGSGAECADANNYARVSCKAQFATGAASRIISNDGDITFNQASGSWGTVTHWAIWDNATYGAGNLLAYGAFSAGKAVGSGQTPKVLTGEIDISIPASNGMTDYLANEMLDHTFLNSDPGFSQPTIYMGLGTGVFADGGAFTNEVADSGSYAREAVAAWTVAANAAENTSAIPFTVATGSWGTVSDWFLADNGTHATGNMLLYGTFDASNAITTDDQVNIPAGDLDITQD
jgi:hypothetical protein